MSKSLELLLMAEGGRGSCCSHCCDGGQWLWVRDLTTQAVIRLRAEEISLYRHTLLLDGVPFRILNIFKPTGFGASH